MDKSHKINILSLLLPPKNHTELLLNVYHQAGLEEIKIQTCRKCLTSFSLGQFTLQNVKPSNHKRRKRRQFRIERLQEQAKSIKTDGVNGRILRLQNQNNHIALYKCFCNMTAPTTKVQLWKKRKQDKLDVPVAAACMMMIQSKDKTTEVASNSKKEKKNRRKTAGLLIPPSLALKNTSKKSLQLNLSKMSQIFQNQSDCEIKQMSNLNQFFK